MLTLFWLALVLGGGLALFSLLGDFFEASADHLHIAHDADGDADWQLLSMRSATYFLFAFGAAGLLSKWSGANTLIATAAAVFCGVAAAVAGAAVFRYLRSTSSGALEGDHTFEGLQARVVLPMRNGRGKISVSRGGRDIELMAECYDADADHPENWKDVVIVEIRGGTALVSPMYQYERTDALLPPATE
jgi:membrane protein implicated in regulation of membrane protease activity